MSDREFRVGDRVKIDPEWGFGYRQTWKKLIQSGRMATVIAVHNPDDGRRRDPRLGHVNIEFDGRFRLPERGQVNVRNLILVDPAKEVGIG